ncbi:hypothetical protein LCGC14_0975240 [marine sediment metagenome]|uniref:Uncharacterized protein n=1 Tax=marine sediment metagenome TaxID=412755 RepID=A0A0F9RGX0_9ZZZZ
MFDYCTCGHTKEDHALDAPPGEQECNYIEDDTACTCGQFEEEEMQ